MRTVLLNQQLSTQPFFYGVSPHLTTRCSYGPPFSALLRSVEGEGLAEYSKRAYNVYRAYGVIQDGVLVNERPPGTAHETARGLSFSSDLLDCRPAASPPSVRAAVTRSPMLLPHKCRGDSMQTGLVRKDTVENGGTCTSNMGVRELVQPFSPPTSPQIPLPTDEQLLKGDGSAPPPQTSTTNADLRVIDLCDEEETVAHKPQEAKLSPRGFRSRLRAPRAGRALALTSANAKGNPIRRCAQSPILGGDLPSKSLAPSPPILTQSAHIKEAWKGEERVEEPHRNRSERCQDEPEISFSEGSSGETDIDSNESGTLGDGAAIISRKELRDGNGRMESPRSKRESRKYHKSDVSVYSDHELRCTEPILFDDDERGRRGSIAASSDGSVCSQRKRNNERPYTETSTSQPTGRSIDSGECMPTAAATQAHSPRLKSCRQLEASNSYGPGDGRSQVSRIERISCGQTGALAVPEKIFSQDDSRGVFHLDEGGGTEDAESMGDNRSGRPINAVVDDASEERDQEAFVWFGQPDTPPTRQLNYNRENRAVPSADVPEQAARTSPHRQQLSKARLLLQMEVRRQREIIEHAFQQREEEGRLRRARLGAEVLKRIRARDSSNPSARAPLPLIPPRTHPPFREPEPVTYAGAAEYALGTARGVAENEREAEHFLSKTHGASAIEPEEVYVLRKAHGIAENGRQTEYLQGGTHNVAQNAREPECSLRKAHDIAEGALSDHPERTIKAWGFGPVDHHANVVKEAPFDLTPDMGASVEASTRAAPIAPVPTKPTEPLPRSAVDNRWRQVGRQVQEEGIAAIRAPTPPSISFDVAMDDVIGEKVGLSGGASEEQARRQERYKALRTRKLAEAEVCTFCDDYARNSHIVVP